LVALGGDRVVNVCGRLAITAGNTRSSGQRLPILFFDVLPKICDLCGNRIVYLFLHIPVDFLVFVCAAPVRQMGNLAADFLVEVVWRFGTSPWTVVGVGEVLCTRSLSAIEEVDESTSIYTERLNNRIPQDKLIAPFFYLFSRLVQHPNGVKKMALELS
jgi:hypothetical protein